MSERCAPTSFLRGLIRQPDPAALRRYAGESVQRTPVRTALIVAGSLLHFLYFVPLTGIAIGLVLLAGEVLRLIEAGLLRAGFAERRPRLAGAVAWIAPSIYALTAGTSVVLIWTTPVETEAARLAALMVCVAFVFDAGFTFRSNPRGSASQIAILVALALGLVIDGFLRTGMTSLVALEIVVLALFAYVCVTFVVDATAFRARQAEARRALEAANRHLKATAADNARLALASRHATDGIVILDAERRIEWANEGYHRLSGYAPGAVVGARLGDLAAAENDPATLARMVGAIERGEVAREELVRRRRDGHRIWVDVAITPIRDEDGAISGFVSVERDITAQKAHAAELAEARRTAETAARSKAAFLATMSHELRTPLNGVLGTADLLRERVSDPDQRLLVDTITESGEYLVRMIDDVLASAKLDAGALPVEVEPFDPRRLARASVELMRPVASRQGVTLTLDVADDVPETVTGDPGRVRQILLNLVGNAVKFTAEGSVDVSLAMEADRAGDRLRMTVTDTGIGIPPDRLEAVFESFTQADRDTARRYGGTGLGLSISRALARELGGDITVRSVPGGGATFRATIAVGPAAVPEAPAQDRDAEEPATGAAGPAPRVLVVDDNRTNRFVIEKMLASTSYRLNLVEDGPSAIAAAARVRPALILMDISMPGMDGFEACRAIRAQERDAAAPRACILALTANGAQAERLAAREAGMDGFLTKPVRKAALLRAMEAQLDGGAPPVTDAPAEPIRTAAE